MKPGTNRVENFINPNPVPLPPWPDQEYQQSTRSRNSSLRTSLRSEQGGAGPGERSKGMRMSMRGNDGGMDQGPPQGGHRMTAQRAAGGFAAQRVAEAPTPPANAPSEAAVALARQQMQKLALQRSKSNGSDDSDSSFRRNKKRRDKQTTEEGRYSMKRSMRDSRMQQSSRDVVSPEPGRSSRFNMRSPSPAESPVRETKGLFGRKSKPRAEAAPAPAFRSRFDDSDDEDVGRPSTTTASRSRFAADSDDEGMAPPPRSAARNVPLVNRETAPAPPHQGGAALQAGTLRGDAGVFDITSQDKKGIRGMFTLNAKKRSPSVDNQAQPPITNGATSPSASPRRSILGGRSKQTDPESPGRSNGGGLLRRLSTNQSQPTTPKKQIVTNPSNTHEWPFLPPPIPESYSDYPGASRPTTGDAAGAGAGAIGATMARPAMGTPKGSFLSVKSAGGAAGAGRAERPALVSRKSGKKKRFQGLRRALGMHD